MIRALDKLVKIVGILIIPIGLVLFSQQYFFAHESLRVSVTSMVAAIIGMIPEGLYLLASVALVVSVIPVSYTHLDVYKRQLLNLPVGQHFAVELLRPQLRMKLSLIHQANRLFSRFSSIHEIHSYLS